MKINKLTLALAISASHAFIHTTKHKKFGINFKPHHEHEARYMTENANEDLKLSDILAEVTNEITEEDVVLEEEIIHPENVKPLEEEIEEIIAEAGHTIESTSNIHTLTINLGYPNNPQPLIFETGKLGRQASGAIMLTRGETVLYSTACFASEAREIDFVPLSVEYQERFSSAGTTSGSFNKRDGRPSEHEILTCRIIDRPIRPLLPKGWHHETQLLTWVLSYDGERKSDPLAVCVASAALSISEIPLSKPIAAVMVGYVNGTFILNPTNKQMESSELELTLIVAGTSEAILMIEGAANFLPEEVLLEALEFAHPAIKTICERFMVYGL